MRTLPSGLVERLVVTEPGYHKGFHSIPGHYQAKYRHGEVGAKKQFRADAARFWDDGVSNIILQSQLTQSHDAYRENAPKLASKVKNSDQMPYYKKLRHLSIT